MSVICATSNVDHEKRVAISMHACCSVPINRFTEKNDVLYMVTFNKYNYLPCIC